MQSTDTLTAQIINLKGSNMLMTALKGYDFRSLENGAHEILVNEGSTLEMTFTCSVNHLEKVDVDFNYFSGTGSNVTYEGFEITDVENIEFFVDGDTAVCEYINTQSITNLLN